MSKGYEDVTSIPVLPANPTLEQLKTGLKTKKTDCAALLANYQCGQNEILSVPSGDIIQVNTGDEIAINSIAFEVVELDGSGNGRGIVKVPMFQNAKFGVEFKGIKVAKGGCVVAGQAELSNVDVALLNEEQRKKLAETYEAFNKVLDVVDANAEGVAETFNSVWALMDGIKDRAAKLAAKLSGGQNPTAKEIKDLAKLTESSAAMLQKSLNDIKKQAQANADAGKVDEMQKIIDQQKANVNALLASAKDIKMGKDKLPTPQDPMEKASTQNQVDALAMTNGADVKKKLEDLGAGNMTGIRVYYAGKQYGDKSEIVLKYEKDKKYPFLLFGRKNPVPIQWTISKEKTPDLLFERKSISTDISEYVGVEFPLPDNDEVFTMKVESDGQILNIKIIRKKPVYKVSDLIAVDYKNPNRIAKASKNETLYIVRNPLTNRQVDYKWVTTAPTEEMKPLITYTPSSGNSWHPQNLYGKSYNIGYTDSPDKGTFAIDAWGYEKAVKVEIVDFYKQKAQVIPTKLQNSLEDVFKGLNNLNVLLKKIDPKSETLEMKPKINISGSQFNEENKLDRFYKEVKEGGVEAGVQLKIKVPLPAPYSFVIDVPYVGTLGKIGAFIDIDFDFGVSGTTRWEKQVNEKEFKNKKNSIGGKVSGAITFGAKIELLPDLKEVNLEAKMYGKAGITGEFKYFVMEDKSKSQIYIDPLIAGVSGKVKVWGKTVWDSKYEYTIFNKYIIYEKEN